MTSKPAWKNCQDCVKAKLPWPHKELNQIAKQQGFSCGSEYRELNGTVNLETLCDKCILTTPCSVCGELIPKPNRLVRSEEGWERNTLAISNYNSEPICVKCKTVQCYRCGEEGDLKSWHGWTICYDCGMELCNMCGGECNKPCANCGTPCDNDCPCSTDGEDSTDDDSSVG